MFDAPPLHKLQEAIASPTNPIGMRMRAAYYLRQAYENYKRNEINEEDDDEKETRNKNDDHNKHIDNFLKESKEDDDGCVVDECTKAVDEIVIETLCQGLQDARHGSLLRHEFAYVMGQIRDERSCSTLEKILLDDSDCIMVRHECGEALGAISSPSSICKLQEAINLSIPLNQPEIFETCSLAISYITWKQKGGMEGDVDQPMVCACMLSPYSSVDPAPPLYPSHAAMSACDIGRILHDTSKPIFERYRAMFSLRNMGTKESIYELGYALVNDESSALLRHEVAYVLGQIQSADSIEVLKQSLEKKDEHIMVRHESAEALGAIEERWDEVERVLKLFLEDEDVVVRESCAVALDAADYWGRACDVTVDDDIIEGTSTSAEDELVTAIDICTAHVKGTSFAQQKAQP